ncbi:MAG: molybdate ABC transporter permease subunit [Bacteroidota bacterium]
MVDWSPIWLTLQLAFVTTVCLFVFGLPICYWITMTKSRIRPFVEALVTLPLVLPPTVLGFYLLICLSPNSVVGTWLESTLGLRLVFTFPGLVIGSMIYSLPFMIHPIRSGILDLPRSYEEAARVLGKSRSTTFLRVLMPNIRPQIITALVLTFAHTIGEFGVVLMIGGNIPDRTRVASIAIFDAVEMMDYRQAHVYALILFLLAMTSLVWTYSRPSKSVPL